MSVTEAEEPDSDAEESRAELENLPELLHNRSRLPERQKGECRDLFEDKFWSSQYFSPSKDLPPSIMQSCESPLASDSSSCLSTRDSSLFSWSECSHNAGMHVPHSPELHSSRVSGFSLFNSAPVNHFDWARQESFASKLSATEVDRPNGPALKHGVVRQFLESGQRFCDGNVENWRSELGFNGYHACRTYQSKEGTDPLDGSLVKNMSHLGSVESSQWQEPQMSNFSNGDNILIGDGLCREHHNPVLTVSLGTKSYRNTVQVDSNESCLDFANDVSRNVMDTTLNGHVFETCSRVSHACSDRDTTLDSREACSLGSCFLIPDNRESLLAAKTLCDASVMLTGNSVTSVPENADCEDERHKDFRIPAAANSAANDGVARHAMPVFLGNAVPKSAKAGGFRGPLTHKKAGHSAVVKETFLSSSMHGQLRVAEQGGFPCYSFFLDGSDEVLFARALKKERESNKENTEWIYSFHSKKDKGKARETWKSRPKKENLVSEVVANMRVSSICRQKAKSNADSGIKESHFVLFGGRGKNQVESQKAGIESKMQGRPLLPVLENASISQLGPSKESSQSNAASPDAKAGGVTTIGLYPGNLSRYNGTEAEGSGYQELRGIKHQAELAAIVISTSLKQRRKINKTIETRIPQKESTGWGMRFLETGAQRGWGLSFMERAGNDPRGSESITASRNPRMHGLRDCFIDDLAFATDVGSDKVRRIKETGKSKGPEIAQESEEMMSTRKKWLTVDVTVILSAGEHGLPDLNEDILDSKPGSSGPTPLLERWNAGGDCDCGGWDIGCGLFVLKAETLSFSKTISSVSLTRNDCINWLSHGSPFKLLTQGCTRKKVLVVEIMEEGLFMVSFQPLVSPLQAFAIAVALFHQQMFH